jgi:hypothetical protein
LFVYSDSLDPELVENPEHVEGSKGCIPWPAIACPHTAGRRRRLPSSESGCSYEQLRRSPALRSVLLHSNLVLVFYSGF